MLTKMRRGVQETKVREVIFLKQWWIQDFPVGCGMDLVGGPWTPEVVTF